METKKFTSYEEIERELAILRLEKEINYNKIKLSFDKSAESIIPFQTISKVENVYTKLFSGTSGTILKTIFPFAVKWLFKSKGR